MSPEAGAEPRLPGDSFWACEGEVLAGPYPGSPNEADAREKVSAFFDLGIRDFIDLTEEGELMPYAHLLEEAAVARGLDASHMRFPILDVSIPTSAQMREILAAIRHSLSASRPVYVHCWGGVGRTGTVLGCLLVEDGRPLENVFDHLHSLRAATERSQRESPETEEQRDFVRGWTAGPE